MTFESVNDANPTTVSDENEALLADSIDEPTDNNAPPLNQFSDDDLEDDELLVEPEEEAEVPDVSPIKPKLDDDSIEDDNLLSD